MPAFLHHFCIPATWEGIFWFSLNVFPFLAWNQLYSIKHSIFSFLLFFLSFFEERGGTGGLFFSQSLTISNFMYGSKYQKVHSLGVSKIERISTLKRVYKKGGSWSPRRAYRNGLRYALWGTVVMAGILCLVLWSACVTSWDGWVVWLGFPFLLPLEEFQD